MACSDIDSWLRYRMLLLLFDYFLLLLLLIGVVVQNYSMYY